MKGICRPRAVRTYAGLGISGTPEFGIRDRNAEPGLREMGMLPGLNERIMMMISRKGFVIPELL